MKKFTVFMVLTMLVVFGMTVVSCGDDNGGGVQIPSQYRGTWEHNSQDEILTITATTIRGHGNAHTARTLFNHLEGLIVNFGATEASPMVLLSFYDGKLWVEGINSPLKG